MLYLSSLDLYCVLLFSTMVGINQWLFHALACRDWYFLIKTHIAGYNFTQHEQVINISAINQFSLMVSFTICHCNRQTYHGFTVEDVRGRRMYIKCICLSKNKFDYGFLQKKYPVRLSRVTREQTTCDPVVLTRKSSKTPGSQSVDWNAKKHPHLVIYLCADIFIFCHYR